MNRVMFEEDQSDQPIPSEPVVQPSEAPQPAPEAGEAEQWVKDQKTEINSDPDQSMTDKLLSLFSSEDSAPSTTYKPYDGPTLEKGVLPENTATLPSTGFFDRIAQSFELETKGPSQPTGAITRLNTSLQQYAADIKKETGINPLDGLNVEQISRNNVGLAGNAALTWSDVSKGPLGMVPTALRTLDSKLGTGFFSDPSVIFEKRVEALKEQFPESKFEPTTTRALLDKSVKDYNGLLEQDSISNERNSWASTAGSVLGSIAGFVTDPINVASMIATRGTAGGIKGILQAVGQNAGAAAVTSLPGMIEGQEQGINSATPETYALNVGLGGAMGGLFTAAGMGVSAGFKALKNTEAGKYFSFGRVEETPLTVHEAFRGGSDVAADYIHKSADSLDQLAKEASVDKPHTAAQLNSLAETQRASAEMIKNNPYGKSAEALELFTDTLNNNMSKFLKGDYNMDLPPSLFDAPEIPHLKDQDWRNLPMQGMSHAENTSGYNYRLDRAINDKDLNLSSQVSDVEGILNQTTTNTAPSTTSRISTVSGNYIPKLSKSGEVKVFDTLDAAMKAKDAISDATERTRTAIGGTKDGKFTLVDDTAARKIGMGASEDEVQQIISKATGDGSYKLHELSVVETPGGFQVIANATADELDKISKFPDYIKLDARRRAPVSLGVTEEGRLSQQATLDKLVQEQRVEKLRKAAEAKARLDVIKEMAETDLTKQDKFLEKHFEYNDELPDNFKYEDKVWGTFTKLDFKEKLQAIRRAIKEFKDCAGE